MSRVPITVIGCRCDRCGHEWIPREVKITRVCPKCKSPYWDRPKNENPSYDDFKTNIEKVLRSKNRPMTWTEIRTEGKLPQLFPNNQWVKRLESDISLLREKDKQNIIHWKLP